jgi:hypothetical protein
LGLIVALIARKRWLSLAGLAIGTAGIVIGAVFRLSALTAISILVGGALMLIQIPLGVRHDLRTMKEMQPKQKP